MKLQKIDIKELFNQYNYSIDILNTDNIKIITGPNGYGKSSIIQMIYNLYASNFYHFFLIPFKSIVFTFQSGNGISTLQINKTIELDLSIIDSDIKSDLNLKLELILQQGDELSTVVLSKDTLEQSISKAGYTKRNIDTWWKNNADEYYTAVDIIFHNPTIIELYFGENTGILMFIRSLESLLINDQRLFNSSYEISPFSNRQVHINDLLVDVNAQTLRNSIIELKNALAKLKSIYLLKDVGSTSVTPLSKDEYTLRLNKLNSTIDLLCSYGITDSNQIINFDYNSQNAQLFTNILLNYEKIISDIEITKGVDKIELFAKLINESDFPNKFLVINGVNGYQFVDNTKKNIPLSNLSSGEQHKLILYYQLLFSTSKDMLILIDEPELSFHVIWQLSFLKEIQEIIKKSEMQVIIATHSPQIIDGNWGLTVDLFELDKNKTEC